MVFTHGILIIFHFSSYFLSYCIHTLFYIHDIRNGSFHYDLLDE